MPATASPATASLAESRDARGRNRAPQNRPKALQAQRRLATGLSAADDPGAPAAQDRIRESSLDRLSDPRIVPLDEQPRRRVNHVDSPDATGVFQRPARGGRVLAPTPRSVTASRGRSGRSRRVAAPIPARTRHVSSAPIDVIPTFLD